MESPQRRRAARDLDRRVEAEADERHTASEQSRHDGDDELRRVPRDRHPLKPTAAPGQAETISGRAHEQRLCIHTDQSTAALTGATHARGLSAEQEATLG